VFPSGLRATRTNFRSDLTLPPRYLLATIHPQRAPTQSLVLPCSLTSCWTRSLGVSIRIEVERFIVWWPHGARKKKAEDRHAREALAQDNLYSLEV
jgi:hypothetical protein